MKETNYTCDRCGTKIYAINPYKMGNYDLCQQCIDEFKQWMATGHPRSYDAGKVLKAAGRGFKDFIDGLR